MATDKALSHREALTLVLQKAAPTEPEQVPLQQACGRVTAVDQRACLDDPGYDQSLRDGFVLSGGNPGDKAGPSRFRLLGEIPAGRCDTLLIKPGETYRIMTGALIPRGGMRVVPQERCHREGDWVTVDAAGLTGLESYIQRRGEVFTSGERLVPACTRLSAYHLGLLGAGGVQNLWVHRRPVVACGCSGSELVSEGDLSPGLKFSSNRYLLRGLIQAEGAVARDQGTIDDSLDTLSRMFDAVAAAGVDVLVTTGGMGPGKYDLLEQAFARAGGQAVFRNLRVAPGKRLLFGTMASTLCFGLPGPPTAVRILFQELVAPALRRLAGLSQVGPRSLRAELEHDLHLPGPDLHRLKEGVLCCRDGGFTVRVADRFEAPDCLLHLPEGVDRYRSGDRLIVHLCNGSAWWTGAAESESLNSSGSRKASG